MVNLRKLSFCTFLANFFIFIICGFYGLCEELISDKKGFKLVALGDSVLIDYWPGNRDETCSCGSISMLLSNMNQKFPDYKNKDIISVFPQAEKVILATDGHTSSDVIKKQLPLFNEINHIDLLVVSFGGNNLVPMLAGKEEIDKKTEKKKIDEFQNDLSSIEKAIQVAKKKNPSLKTYVLNIFDLSDTTGYNPYTGQNLHFDDYIVMYRLFRRFNTALKEFSHRNNFVLIDVHNHFEGHGVMHERPDINPFVLSGSKEKWLHDDMPIDLNIRGAHQIRSLLYEQFERHFLLSKDVLEPKPHIPYEVNYYSHGACISLMLISLYGFYKNLNEYKSLSSENDEINSAYLTEQNAEKRASLNDRYKDNQEKMKDRRLMFELFLGSAVLLAGLEIYKLSYDYVMLKSDQPNFRSDNSGINFKLGFSENNLCVNASFKF